MNIGAREVWNKGINYVNTINNTNTNLTQSYKLSFDNRKKDKWDIMFGGEITLTNAKYSIQKELNRKYYSYTYFGEINYSPNDRLSMRVSGDVTSYNANSFNKEIIVPLVGAEVNYYLTKNKRIMLTLEGADLLDKNKGISRTSNLNYLREVRSNTIGRYFLLSLKFRLNKFGDNDNGMNIKIKNH